MEFNAVIRPSPIMYNQPQLQLCQYHPIPGSTPVFQDVRKRKPEPEVAPIPPKQFLSEELMASHLNNMHLSTEYTSHNIETSNGQVSRSTTGGSHISYQSLDDEMSLGETLEPPTTHHVFMSPKELEERLKKAQRISLCEEVRKLDKSTDILPKALLQRIEKPCTALVLWQPPQTLEKLVTKVSAALKEREQKEKEERRSNEMMMGDDDPLPDLPEYDADLDFEETNNNVASVSDLNSMDVEM